jgi:hypothetical protein
VASLPLPRGSGRAASLIVTTSGPDSFRRPRLALGPGQVGTTRSWRSPVCSPRLRIGCGRGAHGSWQAGGRALPTSHAPGDRPSWMGRPSLRKDTGHTEATQPPADRLKVRCSAGPTRCRNLVGNKVGSSRGSLRASASMRRQKATVKHGRCRNCGNAPIWPFRQFPDFQQTVILPKTPSKAGTSPPAD